MALLYALLRARKQESAKSELISLIYRTKRDLRKAARVRLAAETKKPVAKRPVVPTKKDLARSSKIVSRFAAYAKARFAGISQTDKTKEAKNLRKQAEDAVQNRLRQIASFEALAAFESERRLAAKEIARQTGVSVLKKWDATMDLRTCEECAANNGLEIPLKEEFPSGDPPVHPNCRCSIEYGFDT